MAGVISRKKEPILMAEYIWVSVGGGDCEPAVRKDGKVYTLGCPDPLPETHFKQVAAIANQPRRPRTLEEQTKFEQWLEAERKAGRHHGYRYF